MREITLEELAKKARLAKSTASKILNNQKFDVAPETRERVLRLAREHHYRPNYFARSLKQGKTHCLGIMGSLSVPDFNFTYYSKCVAALENSLLGHASKYSPLIFGTNRGYNHEETVGLIKKGMVDGLFLILLSKDMAAFAKQVLPVLQNASVPFVVIHSLRSPLAYNNVGLDCFHGGYLAGRHLLELGHREIGYYAINSNSPQDQDIHEGFQRALADAGATGVEIPPGQGSHASTFLHAYHDMQQLPKVPPALFVPDDATAYGVIKGLRERGLNVPRDVSLVGFNDEVPTDYFETELTTIHHPIAEKAEAAVRMLLDILDGKLEKDKIHQEILMPHLVTRKTTRTADCGLRTAD